MIQNIRSVLFSGVYIHNGDHKMETNNNTYVDKSVVCSVIFCENCSCRIARKIQESQDFLFWISEIQACYDMPEISGET